MAKPRKAEKRMVTRKPILKVGGSNFKLPAMRFISSSDITIVDNSSKGGLSSSPAGQSAMSGEGNRSQFSERTPSPEVKSPAGNITLKSTKTADGVVERGPMAGGTNTHSPAVSPR